jgi:hypothetical protein
MLASASAAGLGGGAPYFPAALEATIDLQLVETQTFGSRVVYVRYRRPRRS